MTSDALLHDLAMVERLIIALGSQHRHDEAAQRDLSWLQQRRRYLAELQAQRRAQRGKKVVSLELWRGLRSAADERVTRVA